MDRTQIYLTPEQKEALIALSRDQSIPMAELIRLAVDEFLTKRSREYQLQVIHETFGAIPEWTLSGEEYVRQIRTGWQNRGFVSGGGEKSCDT